MKWKKLTKTFWMFSKRVTLSYPQYLSNYFISVKVNPCAAELFASIFHNVKLESLTQFPASNEEKYVYL